MKEIIWLILVIAFGIIALIGGIKKNNRTLVLLSIPSFVILLALAFIIFRNATGIGWRYPVRVEYIKIPTP